MKPSTIQPVYDSEVSKWWSTSIIDMAPGKIEFRGTPIQELMGNLCFVEMIWLMIFGERISASKKELFEVAMVMSVDHGPQAPSIAISRMAATCGVGINNVMSSAINVLGDNHGGAGEQCAQLFYNIRHQMDVCQKDVHAKGADKSLTHAVKVELDNYRRAHSKVIPGYGHRFHKPTDPRSPRVLEIVRNQAKQGKTSGMFADIAEEVEKQISQGRKTPIPMNVDGASAVLFCELGVPAPLSRGLFCLSRSVGILAHAWEQMQRREKNKGPMPKKYLPFCRRDHNE